MAQDDEEGEFAWPAHDVDGSEGEGTGDGGTGDGSQGDGSQGDGSEGDGSEGDGAHQDAAPATESPAGPATEPPAESGSESATTELPVRRVSKPSDAAATGYVDQPTMFVAVPQRTAPPPAPPRIEPQPAGSQRAAPQRIGPQQSQPPPAEAGAGRADHGEPAAPAPDDGTAERIEERPRKRRRWILAAVVVLVVVALGVVLALPSVSNRLALPWAPNAPKEPPPEPSAISRTLHGPRTGAEHRPTPEGVAAALAGAVDNPALGTLTGSVIDPATGRTLWSKGADKPRTPASTTKMLTTAAALLTLDPGMRIPTTVVAGREPGTVILVAHGDVTLSSLPKGETSIYPHAARLDKLVAEVERATGGKVDEVALDLTAYAGDTTAPGWDPVDVPKYTAAAVPAMLDGGRKDPRANHSERVDNPTGVLVSEFADRLGADVAENSTVHAPKDARVLGRVRSAPLTTLVRNCLLLSDNVLADALARQVAMAEGKKPSFAGAAKAIRQVLARSGFDVRGLRLFDGSGLSEKNKVPAGLLANLLSVAAAPAGSGDPRTAKLRPMLAGLPVAGGTGTLAARYDEESSNAGRGWVHAKTGTLTEVNALAGTVLDSDGHVLVFAFMSSGTPASQARPALDALAADLRTCGCSAP